MLNDSFDKDLLLNQTEIKRARSQVVPEIPQNPTKPTIRIHTGREKQWAPKSKFNGLQSIDKQAPRQSARLMDKSKIKNLLVKVLSTRTNTRKLIFTGPIKDSYFLVLNF